MPQKTQKPSLPQAPVDFVIITALEEEREAVLAMLSDYITLDKGEGDIHTYYSARVQSLRRDRSRYQTIVTCLINMGPITATAQTVAVVNRWHPRYIVLVGIACGIEGEVEYGDVIVASQVADYTLGKQLKGKRQVRWSVFPCGASLLDSANNVRGDWYQAIAVERPTTGKPRRLKGVVASGGDVIQDDKIIATYSESWPKLIGIEMESAGVAAGIYQTAERPEFLMIKGVSDFGKDKHDPAVKPWREYACHSAAAFTLSLIKSGPSRSLTEIEEPEPSTDTEKADARRSAEREWAYIQQHRILSIKVFFLLKEDVGLDWFRELLAKTYLHFKRGRQPSEEKSFAIKSLTSSTPSYNVPEHDGGESKPIYAFWERYKEESGYWCKVITPEQRVIDTVSGIEGTIPWDILGLEKIETLQDLAQLTEFGISLPLEAFEIGIEEFELQFIGDTFWFEISIANEGTLGALHELSQMQHSVIREKENLMPLGTSFSGMRLLDMFLHQFLQQRSVLPRPERKHFPMGLCGPGGHEIFFYPDMPKGFNDSPDAKKYSFSLTVENQDFAPYVKEAEESVSAKPTETASYVRLAQLYYAQGRLVDAMNCLKQGIKNAPHGDLHEFLAVLLSKVGRHKESIDYFRGAITLNGDSVSAHTGLGVALSECGRFADAVKHFEKAVEIAPDDPSTRNNLGLALSRNKQYEAAVPHLQHAANSGSIQALKLLGALLTELDRQGEATQYLERAVELEPKDAAAWSQLGSNFAVCKEWEKAVECFGRAVSLNDQSARDHELLGASLTELERWAEAEGPMRRALDLSPDDLRIQGNLFAIRAKLGNVDEIVDLLRRAVQADPSLLGGADSALNRPESEHPIATSTKEELDDEKKS